MWRTLLPASLAVILGGCATGPLQENPLLLRAPQPAAANPVYVPLPPGATAYARLFEKVLDVLTDYWDTPGIAYANRYDGRIETYARIAPGIERPWRPGSPDLYQRLLAYLQTIRHRAIVVITTAPDDGYFIDVKVFKELEDIPAPLRYLPGIAAFRLETTVDRQFEVLEPGIFEPASWIPIGRDTKLEQVLLERFAHIDLKSCPPQ
jgi:hypothetical protein